MTILFQHEPTMDFPGTLVTRECGFPSEEFQLEKHCSTNIPIDGHLFTV